MGEPHSHHHPHPHYHHNPHHRRSSASATIANTVTFNLAQTKSCSGILKFIQLVIELKWTVSSVAFILFFFLSSQFLGSIAIMIILKNYQISERKLLNNIYQFSDFFPILLLLEVATTCFICTCCLLFTTIFSNSIRAVYVSHFLAFHKFVSIFFKINFPQRWFRNSFIIWLEHFYCLVLRHCFLWKCGMNNSTLLRIKVLQ